MFVDTYKMVAFLSKSDTSEGFDQIMDFFNAHTIKYALVVNPTIYVSCIKQFWATATVKKVNDDVQLRFLIDGKKVVVSEAIIRRDLHLDNADGVECLSNADIFDELARMGYEKPHPKITFYKAFYLHNGSRKFNFSKYMFDNMVRNVDSPIKFLMYPRFLQVVMNNQVDDMTTHNTRYTSPALTQKVFANMRRIGKAEEEGKEARKKKKLKHSWFKRLRRVGIAQRVESSTDTILDVNAASKRVSAISAPELVSDAEPIVFDDEDVTMTMDQTLIKLKAEKAKLLDEQIAQKLHDEEVQKAAARDKQEKAYMERALEIQRQGMTYDKVRPIFKREYKKESFKKLRAAKVSGSESTQELPSNDPKEMTEEDVQNMLEIFPVPEFKVEALQVKYPIIDWEIHTEVPSEDKEKALWVELKRLFKPDADDVLWKLQRYMHAPLIWKLYIECGVHHVSSIRGHDIFMLIEKDYPLSNAVMILMLSGKLQVEEDNEMAIDRVMKIFIEASKPRSRSLDTSS
uniref:Xylulose kinase-1 n=1 Tax=Tanacetum cinerariifolium TaxID=118510 RepID=A0A6L2MZA0_TANCI|nr:xylulose kinase-1 [Tanacetum cinerariifolium]